MEETDSTNARWLTAIHEAGHAVIAISVGRPLQRVTIAANRHRLGQCKIQKGRFRPTKDWLEDEILILLAGMVAEARVYGHYNFGGADADLRMMRRLTLNRFGNEQQAERFERRLLAKAEHLLDAPEHWNAVQLIAKDLMERETISGRAAQHWYNQSTT